MRNAMKIEDAIAQLRGAIEGPGGRYWAHTEAVKSVLSEIDRLKAQLNSIPAPVTMPDFKKLAAELPSKERLEEVASFELDEYGDNYELRKEWQLFARALLAWMDRDPGGCMTAQLNQEQLLADIAHAEEKADTLCGACAEDHARLAGYMRMLLARMEQDPVAWNNAIDACRTAMSAALPGKTVLPFADLKPNDVIELFGSPYRVRYIRYTSYDISLDLQCKEDPLSPYNDTTCIHLTVSKELLVNVEVVGE